MLFGIFGPACLEHIFQKGPGLLTKLFFQRSLRASNLFPASVLGLPRGQRASHAASRRLGSSLSVPRPVFWPTASPWASAPLWRLGQKSDPNQAPGGWSGSRALYTQTKPGGGGGEPSLGKRTASMKVVRMCGDKYVLWTLERNLCMVCKAHHQLWIAVGAKEA